MVVPRTSIPPSTVFDVTFSKEIYPESVSDQAVAFRLYDESTGLPVAGVTSRVTAVHYRFTPAAPLTPAGLYTLALEEGIVDLAGHPLTPYYRYYEVSSPAPMLTHAYAGTPSPPAPPGSILEIFSTPPPPPPPPYFNNFLVIDLVFDQDMDLATIQSSVTVVFPVPPPPPPLGTITQTIDAKNFRWTSNYGPLGPGDVYEVQITAGCKNLLGTPISNPGSRYISIAPI